MGSQLAKQTATNMQFTDGFTMPQTPPTVRRNKNTIYEMNPVEYELPKVCLFSETFL